MKGGFKITNYNTYQYVEAVIKNRVGGCQTVTILNPEKVQNK
jgi:hypothetical protein